MSGNRIEIVFFLYENALYDGVKDRLLCCETRSFMLQFAVFGKGEGRHYAT